MADDGTDLLMRMVLADGGRTLPGEGQASLPKNDLLLTGFAAGSFSEIEQFSMGVTLRDESGSADGAADHRAGSFRRWRSPRNTDLAELTFPVDPDAVSIKRLIDSASPVLFDCCSNRRSFSQVSIVKRKAVGGSSALQAFLRFDFTEVLVVGLEWDQDDLVRETCKFIYRGVKVQYRVEGVSGTLGAPASANWNHAMNVVSQSS